MRLLSLLLSVLAAGCATRSSAMLTEDDTASELTGAIEIVDPCPRPTGTQVYLGDLRILGLMVEGCTAPSASGLYGASCAPLAWSRNMDAWPDGESTLTIPEACAFGMTHLRVVVLAAHDGVSLSDTGP